MKKVDFLLRCSDQDYFKPKIKKHKNEENIKILKKDEKRIFLILGYILWTILFDLCLITLIIVLNISTVSFGILISSSLTWNDNRIRY